MSIHSAITNKKTTYDSASRNDRFMKRWAMKKPSPDIAIRDLETLRGRSDDLYKNNALSHGAIDTNLNNIIGSGLKPHPSLDHKVLGITEEYARELEKIILREFNFVASSENIDAERTQNFFELQKSAFYSMLIGGDVFAMLPSIKRKNSPYTTSIALISADQVSNPNHLTHNRSIAGGIEVGDMNEPLFYHILKYHPNGLLSHVDEWQKVRVFDNQDRRLVLHMYNKMEAGQKRGIPYLAPVISLLKMLGDYTDAELTATLISSLYTVFVTSEEGTGLDLDLEEQEESKSDYSLSAGSTVNLKPGEKIEMADPNRPNKSYEIFYRAIVREIGVGLNIPYEILVKHFESSYTAARAGFLEVWKYYKGQRSLVVRKFNQPIYERVIEEGVLLGRIDLPNFLEDPFMKYHYLNCIWTGEVQGAIDEVKEARASKLRIDSGLSTRERESSQINGSSYDENIATAKEESKKMIDANLMTQGNTNG